LRVKLRQEIRTELAKRREMRLEKLMSTHSYDKKTFYKMVKQQRNTTSHSTDTITVEGQDYQGPKEICEGWRKHFENLATPAVNPEFDLSYNQDTEWDANMFKEYHR
jgi:predicted outer membrane protein